MTQKEIIDFALAEREFVLRAGSGSGICSMSLLSLLDSVIQKLTTMSDTKENVLNAVIRSINRLTFDASLDRDISERLNPIDVKRLEVSVAESLFDVRKMIVGAIADVRDGNGAGKENPVKKVMVGDFMKSKICIKHITDLNPVAYPDGCGCIGCSTSKPSDLLGEIEFLKKPKERGFSCRCDPKFGFKNPDGSIDFSKLSDKDSFVCNTPGDSPGFAKVENRMLMIPLDMYREDMLALAKVMAGASHSIPCTLGSTNFEPDGPRSEFWRKVYLEWLEHCDHEEAKDKADNALKGFDQHFGGAASVKKETYDHESVVDEKLILKQMRKMCEQGLDPEKFDLFEMVERDLKNRRHRLKD